MNNHATGQSRTVRRGVSLIDLLVTVAILAILAAIVLPGAAGDDRLRIQAASLILASDLEFAQSMTVAFPKDPVIVTFNSTGTGYYLAFASDPGTPLHRPDTGEPYVVRFGQGRAAAARGVRFQLHEVTDRRISFNEHGGLQSFDSTPEIRLSHDADASNMRIAIAINSMTGTITETRSRTSDDSEPESPSR